VSSSPAPNQKDLCPHFGTCGGCQHQDIPYTEQLQLKERNLAALFAPFWPERIVVAPSPVLWNYRNKVDLTFGRKFYPEPPPKGFPRETVLGFKSKGKWFWTIDIQECRIGPTGLAPLMDAVRQWARARGYPAFSSRSKDGLLRILLVREGKRTGQRMVVLITCEGDVDRNGFVDAVLSSCPATSIQHGVLTASAEIAAADRVDVLRGNQTIEEELHVPTEEGTRRLRFRLSPFSFFQTNTLAAEQLYGHIRRKVRSLAPSYLYDLYGGSGGIALACADLVEGAESVESVPAATADGRRNAEMNSADTVAFVTAQVRDYLGQKRAGKGLRDGSVVVVDPPRPGLHPKALHRLIELAPSHVLYVSCKPTELARELPAFLDGYELVNLDAYDLFPHTRHIECLAHLARRRHSSP